MKRVYSYNSGQRDRGYWLDQMLLVGEPVLTALAERRLRLSMPVESAEGSDRSTVTYLEALGRLLSGMAPWLESGERSGTEGELRSSFTELAREALDAATDPGSVDYMNFSSGLQPIVDTAFLAQAILRAPTELWEKLELRVKRNVIIALKQTRSRKPVYSNWLLFSALIEATLFRLGEPDWDQMRIDYALKQHEQWYVGDGAYSDGPSFHWDYYNSYVIQPMLVEVIETVGEQNNDWSMMRRTILDRAERYAAVLERLIAPDGTFPLLGRSLAYRCGAFHSLAQSALYETLPDGLRPEAVRSALTEVIRRTLDVPHTFDGGGWLTIGLSGHQPGIGEHYISTGSLYLCTMVFLPLGLSAAHPFWSRHGTDWTARLAWRGASFPIDKALV